MLPTCSLCSSHPLSSSELPLALCTTIASAPPHAAVAHHLLAALLSLSPSLPISLSQHLKQAIDEHAAHLLPICYRPSYSIVLDYYAWLLCSTFEWPPAKFHGRASGHNFQCFSPPFICHVCSLFPSTYSKPRAGRAMCCMPPCYASRPSAVQAITPLASHASIHSTHKPSHQHPIVASGCFKLSSSHSNEH